MRFFQRLAPGARLQHAVQPVLPPRFAGAGADPGAALTPAQPADVTTASPLPGARASAARAPDAQAAPRMAGPQAPQGRPAPGRGEAGAAQPPLADPLRAPSPLPGHLHAAPEPGAAPPSRTETGAAPAAAHAPEAAARARSRHDELPIRTIQGPLSEHALGRRMQLPDGEAPIVHVTIDRIDVRAPAPAQAPRAPAKPRPAPSTSLADYLRRGRT